jgi:hypothetical protein
MLPPSSLSISGECDGDGEDDDDIDDAARV